jgi:hypothetical protein
VVSFLGRDHLESEAGVLTEIVAGEQRAADADMNAPRPVEQALLRGAPERRAVRVGGAEVRVPGIEVCVEVDDGDRPVHGGERAQQRERDRVVATQGEQVRCAFDQPTRAALDLGDRLVDAERVDREVAGVHDLQAGKR